MGYTVNMINMGTLCDKFNYGTEKQRDLEEKVYHETSCYTMALLIVFYFF